MHFPTKFSSSNMKWDLTVEQVPWDTHNADMLIMAEHHLFPHPPLHLCVFRPKYYKSFYGEKRQNTFFAITSKVDFGSSSFFLENWSVFHAEFEYDTHDECNRK